MHIKTERLIVRSFMEQDAEALLEIKYDEQVMKYHPTFFDESTERKANLDFIKVIISYFRGLADKGLIYDERHLERGGLFAVCLKDSTDVIGVITLNRHTHANEWHMGWYFLSQYTGMGYASEASAAASDFFLESLSLDYISAGMRDDNPASFRTAQQSGFKLIEKRIGFDYNNADCNVEDFSAVGEYFAKALSHVGLSGYYFQKRSKQIKQDDDFS